MAAGRLQVPADHCCPRSAFCCKLRTIEKKWQAMRQLLASRRTHQLGEVDQPAAGKCASPATNPAALTSEHRAIAHDAVAAGEVAPLSSP